MLRIYWRPFIGKCLIFLVILFSVSPQFQTIYSYPNHLTLFSNERTLLEANYPISIQVNAKDNSAVQLKPLKYAETYSKPVFLEPVRYGKAQIDFQLFGVIPIRHIDVDVIPPFKLNVGGKSIGIVLKSEGVMVVGLSPVANHEEMLNPARKAGIQVGDCILTINNIYVTTDLEVAEMIDQCGKKNQPLEMVLRRNQKEISVTLNPVLCSESNRYRIGLFVRDSTVGVGTMTFIEPHTGVYGALGHMIMDADTNEPFRYRKGKIIAASVTGVQLGEHGQPGEKIGKFIDSENEIGTIEKNTPFGIYGILNQAFLEKDKSKTLEVAAMSQIEKGYAEILTVIDNEKIETFAVEIEKINMQNSPQGKGLVVKVIDEKLLSRTGGIVQGMSGSPIIQNGKIIGAVTHVFLHDPTKGYGCFMDWMLMESGLMQKSYLQSMPTLFG